MTYTIPNNLQTVSTALTNLQNLFLEKLTSKLDMETFDLFDRDVQYQTTTRNLKITFKLRDNFQNKFEECKVFLPEAGFEIVNESSYSKTIDDCVVNVCFNSCNNSVSVNIVT
jgi:hypothetical protein